MATRTGYHQNVDLSLLTPRQREVLELVAQGRTNGEIAGELGIGFDTVKTHVSEILGKLGVESREEAAAAWRANQGVVSRLRRLASGLFAGTAGKAIIAAGVTGVAVVGTVALVLAVRGNSPAADDPAPAVTTATATGTPNPGATPTTDTRFGPTLTDAQIAQTPGYDPTMTPSPTVLPRLTSIGGVTLREFAHGDPIEFPTGLILYYRAGCYQCDAGTANYFRAYRDSSGVVRHDRIVPDAEPEGAGGPYMHSFVSDGFGEFWALRCQGYCGGVGEATPGSTLELLRSRDGGVTWEHVRELEPTRADTYTMLVGASGGEVLISTGVVNDAETRAATGQTTRVELEWYPSGRVEQPPAGFEDRYALPTVFEGGLAWARAWHGAPSSDSDITLWRNGATTTVPAPGESRLEWHSLNPRAAFEPVAYWRGWQGGRPGGPSYFVATDSTSGAVRHAFFAPNDIRVLEALGDGRLVGNAIIEDLVPALIDLDAGTLQHILGLPGGRTGGADASTGGPYTFPYAVFEVTPWRVVAGEGDCLNLREDPSTGAQSLGCYADGVLFREAGEASGGWRLVLAPDGKTGWAAAEFLR